MPTVTQKGQVTIPKRIRQWLGIKHGDEVVFEIEEKRIILRKKYRKANFRKYIGFLQNLTGYQVDNIVRQLREGKIENSD